MLLVGRASVLLLPISFGIGIARRRVRTVECGDLLVRIGQGNNALEIERDVAWALSDPTARIAVRATPTGNFVNSTGHPVVVEDLSPKSVRLIEDPGGATLALIHDASLERDQPELLDAVASATRLAMGRHEGCRPTPA